MHETLNMSKPEPTKPTKRRTVLHPGIVQAARDLGCSRVTLYKMLKGYPGFAELKTLRTRYEAWQKANRLRA